LAIKHDFDNTAKWQRSMQYLAEDVIPAMPSVKSVPPV